MSAIDEIMKWDASRCDTAWDRNMVRAFQDLAERVQLLSKCYESHLVDLHPVQKAGDDAIVDTAHDEIMREFGKSYEENPRIMKILRDLIRDARS